MYSTHIALNCGVVILQGFIKDAKIVIIIGIVLVDLYGTADQIDGARALSRLLRDQAKQMKGIRLIRLRLQNLSVKRLGASIIVRILSAHALF